jgi:O-antigen/teichoic acid export membrane protein
VYLIIAIINVIGTWFAMKKWGIIGAAAITGIALIFGQGIIMNWYYKIKTGLEIGRYWKDVCKIYVIPIIMCLITVNFSKVVNFYTIPNFIIGVIIYSLIYIVLNWFIVMNEYEKNIFIIPLKNIATKIKAKKNDSSN